MKRILSFVIIATVALGLSACSNMSKQNKNTAIGATVGAVGGAILTDGSALGKLPRSHHRAVPRQIAVRGVTAQDLK